MANSWSVRAVAGAALAVLLAPGCSDDAPRRPSTAQITEGADDADLERSLLSGEDLESVPMAPPTVYDHPLPDASLFDNPDPRAPCGEPVEQPDYEEAAIAAFSTERRQPEASAFQAVWDLPRGEAAGYISVLRDDARPGCPPYVSETPVGEQRAEFLGLIPTPGLGDDALGISLRIDVAGAPPFHAVGTMVRRGNRLSVFQAFAPGPIPEPFVRGVTKLMADRL